MQLDETLTVNAPAQLNGANTLAGATTVSGSLTTTGTVDMSGSSVTLPAGAVPYAIRAYELAVDFSDLGSGASDAIALAGFPGNVYVLGGGFVPSTAFAGEADLAAIIGDTSNDDGIMVSQTVHGVAAGTFIVGDGAETGFHFEADWAGDGAAITFTATELDDVSSGAGVVRIFYVDPNPS